jgi:tetratricopeptide (TPR) repeat protein
LATHDSHVRNDAVSSEPLTDAERDARIEQLLLAGLDEYFAGTYEHAINLWTRVLFLDRHHDRARAYIERARSAQAEEQRETEAVLQQGIEAFQQGDVQSARRLIAAALDRGASREDAQGLLDRIERLGTGQSAPPRRRRTLAVSAGSADPTAAPDAQRRRGWVAAILLVAAALGVLAIGFLGVTPLDPASWSLPTATAPPGAAVSVLTPDALPVAAANEAVLARSRALADTGRLHDALAQLDRIPVGDTLYAEANALRTRVQRELLAVAAAELSLRPSPPPGSPHE